MDSIFVGVVTPPVSDLKVRTSEIAVMDAMYLEETTGVPVTGAVGGGGATLVETLWTDDSNTFYVREDNGITISWFTPAGVSTTAPGTGIRPAGGASIIIDATRYQATVLRVSDIALNDYLSHIVTADPTTGAVIASFWLNVTQNTKLATPPSSSIIAPISAALTAALPLGSNIIGKVGIDQTTPGTTNGVVVSNKPVGAASFTAAQASIGTSAALIVAARIGAVGTGRVSVTIYNSGTTAVYYGASSGVTASTGAILPAGASITLDATAAIYGITASGTNVVSVTETF